MEDDPIKNRGSKTEDNQTRKEVLESSPVQLIVEKLHGKNFREWAQSIKLAIDGKGKLGYLTGETKQPKSADVHTKNGGQRTQWSPHGL